MKNRNMVFELLNLWNYAISEVTKIMKNYKEDVLEKKSSTVLLKY